MDISLQQASKRAKRLNVVEKGLREVKLRKRILNYNKFVLMIMEQFCCSDRTAKEYIKVAKSRIKGGIDKIWAEEEINDGNA